MAQNWTPEQLEAITQRDCSLLVAAAAGAGKTAVLVERIIRKITDADRPVDIDRLLVVTFTNAAATEMRERIGNALAEALEADPSSENLQRQMALLDRASIMTLHSFCMEVVRNHFHSLDLDPLFRICDETESELMKLDVLEELFEEEYESQDRDSPFFRLVDSYGGGRDDSALREMVLTLHRFTSSHPWPEQWLATQAEAYNIGASACLSSTPWARVLLKGTAAQLQGLAALLDTAAGRASQAQGLEPYLSVFEADKGQVDLLLQLCKAAEEAAAAAATYATTAPGGRTAAESGADTGATEAKTVTPAASATRSDTSDSCAATAAAALADEAWDALHNALASVEYVRLPRCKKDADKKTQDQVKTVRNQMKAEIKKLYESGLDATAAEIKEDLGRLYPLIQYLSQMVCRFESMFLQKKRDKGLLDFNDLEHYCLKVLIDGDGKPTAAAKELSERYEEILVDEYQDSNLIQEFILETVSGKSEGRHNIFMVGDVKQSIYRFRQARPELFMSKYLSYPHESGHDKRVIQLYKNFRSRSEVIHGVNYIFKQIMSEMAGELDYTTNEYLNPGAVYEQAQNDCVTGGAIEVHILDVTSASDEIVPESETNVDETGPEDTSAEESQGNPESNEEDLDTAEGEQDEESLDNIQAEARIVGKRIKSLISDKTRDKKGFYVYDKKEKKYRPAEYRDIVILMRTTRNWADVFSDELAVMGIPAYSDAGLGYFRTVEVETMLSLLQIIDNPLQDIPMLSVLRSPIGSFNEDELADIRLANRTASIYEAMKITAGYVQSSSGQDNESQVQNDEINLQNDTYSECDGDSGLKKKTAKFLKNLDRWRLASQYTPTDELVWQLLSETGYYSYVGILPGGQERQANLRMLFERARQYEETIYKGLFNFINFINRLRSGGGDMGSAKILGENDNVVRIMSIHKSKGLEFPIVIVAGCGKKFNMLDLNAGILLHQELGFGPELVDLERRTIIPTMPKFAIRQKLRMETLSEEMRIMYVAFTRAREKLIITGSVRNINRACSRWCAVAETEDEKLPSYSMIQASNYLDWICPSLVRHESGKPIRWAAAGYINDELITEDASCWEVRLWGAGAARMKSEEASSGRKLMRWLEEGELADESSTPASDSSQSTPDTLKHARDAEGLIEMLQWQYPYRMLSSIPAKISVTELKRRFSSEDQEESAAAFIAPLVEKPSFMEKESRLSAAQKGTIMHFVMQHIDLKRLAAMVNSRSHGDAANTNASNELIIPEFLSEIKSQLALLTANEQLTAAEADTVSPEAIAAFFNTSVGRRMLRADHVHREMTFNIEISCADVYSELADKLYSDETMLLQGVIDCWFESEEGIVLLDYKTDYVPRGGEEIIRKRYKVQIEYYTRALEKIVGKKVSERYMYLFHTGSLLKM